MIVAVEERKIVAGPVRRLPYLGLLLGAAFLFYALLWPSAPLMTPDTPSYMRLAADIRNLSLSELSQRTPGYPLLLLAAGSAVHLTRALFLITLALQVGAAGLMAWCLRLLGFGRAAILAFALFALLPPYVAPAAYAETESLCAFSLVLSYAALLKWVLGGSRTALWTFTLAATFTALVRPTYEVLLPAAACCAVFWFRRRALVFAPALLVFAGTLGGYAMVNYERFGYFDLSSMGALALSHKTAGFVEFLPESGLRRILVKSRDDLLTEPYSDHTGQDFVYRAMPELLKLYGGDRIRTLKEVKAASLWLIARKPMSYLHDSAATLATYWMPNEYSVATQRPGLRAFFAAVQWAAIGAFFLQLLAVVGGAMAGCLRRVYRDEPRVLTAYSIGMAIILYTMLVSCFVGIGQARYRVPVESIAIAITLMGMRLWRRMLEAS